MTLHDAQQEARNRWGDRALAIETDARTYQNEDMRFWVSSSIYPAGAVVGQGASWEAAFADADRKEKATA